MSDDVNHGEALALMRQMGLLMDDDVIHDPRTTDDPIGELVPPMNRKQRRAQAAALRKKNRRI